MTHLIKYIWVFVLLSPAAWAQQWRLFVTPSTIADATPHYRLGVSRDVGARLEASLALGFGHHDLNRFRLKGTDFHHRYQFWVARPEIRYSLKNNNKTHWQLALEGFCLGMKAGMHDGYYYNNEQTTYYERGTFEKWKAGLNVKTNLRIHLSPRLLLEMYLGLGAGLRKISYTDIVVSSVEPYPTYNEWWSGEYKRVGYRLMAQVPFGLQIGYVIKK